MSRFTPRRLADRPADILPAIERLERTLDELKETASHDAQEHISRLRERLEGLWQAFDGEDRSVALRGAARQAGRAAYQEASQHPLRTVFVALGVVAVAGWLITRRN